MCVRKTRFPRESEGMGVGAVGAWVFGSRVPGEGRDGEARRGEATRNEERTGFGITPNS